MSSAPQPNFLWSFNGSNVESIAGIVPNYFLRKFDDFFPYVDGIYKKSVYINYQPAWVYYAFGSKVASKNITLTCWINSLKSFPDPTHKSPFISLTDTSGSQYNLEVEINSKNQSVYATGGNIKQTLLITSPLILPTFNWSHHTVTLSTVGTSNTVMSYYFNGLFQVSGNVTRIVSTSSPTVNSVTMGGINNDYTSGGECYIEDVRLYNQSLNSQQIQGIYNSKGMPPNLLLTKTSANPSTTTLTGSSRGTYSCTFN